MAGKVVRDLTGQRFGFLLVLRELTPADFAVEGERWRWAYRGRLAQCYCTLCESVSLVWKSNLVQGEARSCGKHPCRGIAKATRPVPAKYLDKRRERYRERRAHGFCPTCPRMARPGRVHCLPCALAASRKRQQAA